MKRLKVDELGIFYSCNSREFCLEGCIFLGGGYACSWIFVTLAICVFLPQGEGGMVSVESLRCILFSGYAYSRMMLDSFFPAFTERVTKINFDLITQVRPQYGQGQF